MSGALASSQATSRGSLTLSELTFQVASFKDGPRECDGRNSSRPAQFDRPVQRIKSSSNAYDSDLPCASSASEVVTPPASERSQTNWSAFRCGSS